jgi:hypothetical protein
MIDWLIRNTTLLSIPIWVLKGGNMVDLLAEDAAPQCKCYRYEPDRDTKYADIMTGGDGEGWTVTQDCEIHRKTAAPAPAGKLSAEERAREWRVPKFTGFDGIPDWTPERAWLAEVTKTRDEALTRLAEMEAKYKGLRGVLEGYIDRGEHYVHLWGPWSTMLVSGVVEDLEKALRLF